jgi:hypothetical protein
MANLSYEEWEEYKEKRGDYKNPGKFNIVKKDEKCEE